MSLDGLLTHATSRLVPAGEAIFEQGRPATHFFLLIHGRLKVTQVTHDGQQIIVRVVHPGDLFGFARALQRADYPGTATTAAESVILSWQTDLWPQFVEQNPHLAVSAMQTIGQRLEEAHTRIREMSTQEVERRVAHAVLRLSQQAGRKEVDGIRIDFPISRQDIAEMTGTTLHTVSRILSSLGDQGAGAGRAAEASGLQSAGPCPGGGRRSQPGVEWRRLPPCAWPSPRAGLDRVAPGSHSTGFEAALSI